MRALTGHCLAHPCEVFNLFLMSFARPDIGLPLPHIERYGKPTIFQFLGTHLGLPLVAVLVGSGVLLGAGGDQLLADKVYRLQGEQWAWRESWVTHQLLYQGGKWLSNAAMLAAVACCLWAWLASSRSARAAGLRTPLLYLVLAGLLGAGMVSVLKSLTNMDCPWSLERYGGLREFVGLFETRPQGMGRGVCFPAGHASAGYAWVSLYFFARLLHPAWRWRGLAVGLVAGGVFGFTQQVRGAHFLSHDLWALATCWVLALGVYLCFRRFAAGMGPSVRVPPSAGPSAPSGVSA